MILPRHGATTISYADLPIRVSDDMYIEERDGMFKKGWDWMDIPYRKFEYGFEVKGMAVLDSRFKEFLDE